MSLSTPASVPTPITIPAALQGMVQHFQPDAARGLTAVIQMNISGEGGGTYQIKIAKGQAELLATATAEPTLTLNASVQHWLDITFGKLDGVKAFMTGKLKVEGDMGLLMKFPSLFKRP